MKLTDNMHIEEFKSYNQYKTVFWLIVIYTTNIIMSLSLSLVYRLVFPEDPGNLSDLTMFIRGLNLLLTLVALYWVIKRRIRWAKIYIVWALITSFLLQIGYPNPNFVIAIFSLSITLIISLYLITTLWMKNYLTAVWGLAVILIINIYPVYLIHLSIKPEMNLTSLMIVVNYLMITLVIFNISVHVFSNRMTHYLGKLLYIDLKTGLSNERDFEYAIGQLVKIEHSFAIVSLYINNLGELNSQHGFRVVHEVYLNEIKRLSKVIDYLGKPYKLDGPLFAFIIRGNALSINEDLKNLDSRFNAKYIHDLNTIHFQVQWMGTRYPNDGDTSLKLINNLYHLKHRHDLVHEQIHWYNQADYNRAQRLLVLESDLYVAIESCQMKIVLQPQLNLKTNQLHGAEVLARWDHPKYGPIGPLEFIPIIERLNLMNAFTSCIFKLTAKALDRLVDQGVHLPRIAINITASTIMDGSIIQMVQDWPKSLELEITESTLMDLTDQAKNTLSTLKKLGYTLSIDDFGTGYSNLQSLHTLDITYLKIDKQFVDAMIASDKALKLVKALLSMAHNLNIAVVAEGVESKEQYDLMKQLECDVIQGYYYAKPLEVEDFIQRFK